MRSVLPELGQPLRTALRISPDLRRGLPLTVALALLGGTGRVVAPLTVKYALEHDLAADAARRAVLAGVVALVVAGSSSWALIRRLRTQIEDAIAQLRSEGLARAHDMAADTADRLRSGDVIARVTDDLDAMTNFLQGGGIQFVTNLAQMTVAAVVLLIYSPVLAAVVFVVAALLNKVMRFLQGRIKVRFATVRTELSRLQGALVESLTGATTIQMTGSEERARSKLDAAIDRVRDAQLRTQPVLNLNSGMGEGGTSLMTLTLILAGIWWATSSDPPRISAAELIAMIFLIQIFVRPMQFIMQSLGEAQNALTGWRRAVELVITPSGAVTGGESLPDGAVGVGFFGVVAGYGDGPDVLHRVNVRIEPGEHVAVVGRTGSGKSTFAKLLTRRLITRRGSITLSGVPLGAINDASFARRVVVVPQEPFLFNMSIGDNIAVGRPGATRADVLQTVNQLGLTAWLAALPNGLDTPAGTRGERLSVGERQLVALIRTALADPDLLVLDEATSGVDPATDVALQTAWVRLTAGRTTITIAHRLHTAAQADRILVFSAGRIAEQGTHDALLSTEGIYAGMFAEWRKHSQSTGA